MKNKTKKLFAGILVGTMLLTGCAEEGKDKGNDIGNKDVYVSFNDGEYKYTVEEFRKPLLTISGMESLSKNVIGHTKTILSQDIAIENIMKEKELKIEQADIDKYSEEITKNFGGKEKLEELFTLYNIDKDTFYDLLLSNLKIDKIKENYKKENKIDEKDIKKQFEENKEKYQSVEAKHILVEDEQLAKEIIEKLNKGEKFETLANEYSIDKVANESGGDLGFVSKELFDADFVDAAMALKENTITQKPVKTQFGYHIISIGEKKLELDEEISKQIEDELIELDFAKYINAEYDKIKEDVKEVKEDEVETTDKENEKVEDNTSKDENVDNKDEANDTDDVEEVEEEPAKKKVD